MSFTGIVSLFLLLSHFSTSSTTAVSDDLTAYEILQDYDLPSGILPKGATGYQVDRNTGRFHAYLSGSCSFSLEGSYELSYKSTISGYISKGRLTQISGVSVKVLFFWLNIVEVVRSGDEMEFSVGIASANFPIDNFYESPQCGCGLDCNNAQYIQRMIV
ncbi:hypothetical protein HS088_TW18G00111 [Tripterygium wilfordii]|uniref:Uncharacterized protein n=1 Tax=Tripterygium wilfordii TaxID=458696 RepID=A0A7J7CB75_TRIWF|nr:hypothetical protein HS088_TW18G00111 [Tripterygium wilfordii]